MQPTHRPRGGPGPHRVTLQLEDQSHPDRAIRLVRHAALGGPAGDAR